MHRAASYTPALCGPEKAALGAAEHRPPSVRPSLPAQIWGGIRLSLEGTAAGGIVDVGEHRSPTDGSPSSALFSRPGCVPAAAAKLHFNFYFFLAGGLQLSSLRWFCRAITRTAGEAAGGDGLNGLRSQQWMGTRWRGSGAAPQEPDVGSAAFPKVFIHPRQRPFNKKDFSVMENSVASI